MVGHHLRGAFDYHGATQLGASTDEFRSRSLLKQAPRPPLAAEHPSVGQTIGCSITPMSSKGIAGRVCETLLSWSDDRVGDLSFAIYFRDDRAA